MINKSIKTKDYLVTGESFKIALDQQTGVLKTMPAPTPESLKKYYQTQQYISYTSNPKPPLEKAYVFVRKHILLGKSILKQTGNTSIFASLFLYLRKHHYVQI